MVIAGDDKGRTGRVLSVDAEKMRVVVEKVNFVKRHTKAKRQGVQGGILEREAPLRGPRHASRRARPQGRQPRAHLPRERGAAAQAREVVIGDS
jgi:ribosomal protein L24